MTDDMRTRVADLRAKAGELPSDDGRRITTLNLLSDADAMLDAAERKLGRAAREFATIYDAHGAPLRGGWSITRS